MQCAFVSLFHRFLGKLLQKQMFRKGLLKAAKILYYHHLWTKMVPLFHMLLTIFAFFVTKLRKSIIFFFFAQFSPRFSRKSLPFSQAICREKCKNDVSENEKTNLRSRIIIQDVKKSAATIGIWHPRTPRNTLSCSFLICLSWTIPQVDWTLGKELNPCSPLHKARKIV